ncbi:MAG: S-layer homology domain-containing protein [Oscillospiraceae bacterium]|nr:S-layer homology domain-containing protein [Oscillospiraceae bacterium]
MKATTGRKLLSMALALVMAASLLPMSALADTGGADTQGTAALSGLPADGATVAIFNDGNNAALSAATGSNGKGLAGTAATPAADGSIAGSDIAALTVGVEADGSLYFTHDGAYLTSAATGNNLSLAAEKSDYALWLAEDAGSGLFYLKNKAAVYSKNGSDVSQYLEYYNGNFTTYSMNTGKTGLYAVSFRSIAEAESAPTQSGAIAALSDLTDGSTVLIYNPGNSKAVNAKLSGNKLEAVDLLWQDGKPVFTDTMVWTVSLSEGVYSFSNGKNKMGCETYTNSKGVLNAKFALSETAAAAAWDVSVCNGESSTFYVANHTVNNGETPAYLEYYSGFSAYFHAPAEGAYGMQFIPVDPADAQTGGGIQWDKVLNDGAQVVIYNAAAGGSFGIDESGLGTSLSSVPTAVTDGKACPDNGAYVFTVGIENGYYTFCTGGKYLTTNDKEELFLADTLGETGLWYLKAQDPGYVIYNKSANYNGTPVCVEFYSGSFSGWTFKSSDASIFAMQFLPLAEGVTLLDGMVNVPAVRFTSEDSVPRHADYSGAFTLDDLTPTAQIAGVTAVCNDAALTLAQDEKDPRSYRFTVPAAVTAEADELSIGVTVSYAGDAGGYSGALRVTVLDVPLFTAVTLEAKAETGDDKQPLIAADVLNTADGDGVTMTLNGTAVDAVLKDGRVTYQPETALRDGRVTVSITVTRGDGATATKQWSFTVGTAAEQLYFGQLHSHTTYSDGSGTLETALSYIDALPESANIQFVAFTDHSNYFDTTAAANPEGALYDMSLASAESQEIWNRYKSTVAAFNDEGHNVIALAGFEMTWSGGPGHINTWCTPGIVSRNNSTLNNKTDDAGMKAYYALLCDERGANSISQFNHPGKTFGNFQDFSYWNAVTDSRIYTVEVGNGEGPIGQGGYYPSYEQYTMALDKGWHVAPTNNQDNHKGRWGNANDARDVILTDDFSEQGIYAAMRAMKMYATEDKNLELYYTVNGQPLGSQLAEVPDKLALNVQVSDPDESDAISKVEVIVNSGKVAHSWTDAAQLASGTLSATLDPDYSYYYIRVTEADGDLAVTAPVWVGETLKLGISALACDTAMPVTGEELTLTTTLFNSETTPATVKSVVYTTNGSEVLHADTAEKTVPASATLDVTCALTPEKAKLTTVTVTVVLEQNGKEFTYTKDITLDVQDAEKLVYIGIDASHYNEYVSGNYKDNMGNFAALAATYGVRTVELRTSDELIAACDNEKYVALVFTAPSRRLAAAQSDPRSYSEAELAAIKAFNANGGVVVAAGWSDYYENYKVITEDPAVKHMAAAQNELLAALGAHLRIADDATHDDALNGGQTQRLYFSTYNMDNPLMDGIVVDADNPNDRIYSEVFSHYGGASIYAVDDSGAPTDALPATVSPAVYGHASTYSKDSDGDGLGGETVPKYAVAENDKRLLITATEQLGGQGLIVVSGAAFLSNFEVQASVSSGASDTDQLKNYANYKFCENLAGSLHEVVITPIAEVQAQPEAGYRYTIEGVVTSNASGYDKDTAFFDCIYVQDETGGICCFPVAGNFKLGDRVRISGSTDFYQGEAELQVSSITALGEGEPVEPTVVTAAQLMSGSVQGRLVTVRGTVDSFAKENGLVQTIMVSDGSGTPARVFIDGYITTDIKIDNLAVGCKISVTGLASYDDTFNAPEGPFARLRVRDRADVVCTASGGGSSSGGGSGSSGGTTAASDTVITTGEDGTTVTSVLAKDGSLLSATAALSRAALASADGSPAVLPVTVPAARSVDKAPALSVTLPAGGKRTLLEIPTGTDSFGVVVYEKQADGSVRLRKDSRMGKPGRVIVPVDENCTLYVVDNAKRFADVADTRWYADAVDYVSARGIFNGTGNGFAPNDPMSRAMVAQMLYNLAEGKRSGAASPFSDVHADNWFADPVLWASEADIVKGSDGAFRPNDAVTRQELVTILYRYAQHTGCDTGTGGTLSGWPDAEAVSPYAVDAMRWALRLGIIDGLDGTLSPRANATRAQVATVMMRFLQNAA